MYRTMVLIRRFEQRAVDAFHASHIPGGVHAYIGQAAVAFAEASPLPRPEDALLDVFAP
jgi:acetoin:2,6-dichlorophenolindophenol oxidoreductase subunit alpha